MTSQGRGPDDGQELEDEKSKASSEALANDELTDDELATRTLGGAFGVFSLSGLNLLIGFVGTLFLARLLTPRDFGLVAIGASISILAVALTEGGLGSGLLRRPMPPRESELRTLTGLQLALATIGLAIAFAVAPFVGIAGWVTALMLLVLPVSSLQTSGRVVLARSLLVNRISLMDTAGQVVQYLWSVAAVLAGAGVWGLASGQVIRSLTSLVLLALIPGGRLYRPTLEVVRELGPVIRFGLKFQASWITIVTRDLGVNATVGAVGGVNSLGRWSLANRLLQVPILLPDAIGRVTFPAMVHLLKRHRPVRPVLERIAQLTATGSAFVLAPFVASSPGFVPLLFGDRWLEVAHVFPGACLGLLIGGAIGTSATGYLLAQNKAGDVLRSNILEAIVVISAAAAFVPFLDMWGIGIAWALGAALSGVYLVRAVRRIEPARIGQQLPFATLAAVAGGAAGWLGAADIEGLLLRGLVGGGVAFAVVLTLFLLLGRAQLMDFSRTTRRALLSAVSAT